MASKHKFEALDGLRGVLALMVALFHLPLLSHFYDLPTIRHAGVAVDFFFVLSGFVITHASLDQLVSWKAGAVFAIRRFGRVWPLHATMLGLYILNELLKLVTMHSTGIYGKFAAFSADNTTSLASIPTNLLLIHALNIHDKLTWNGPSWSISTEFYTYLLFALLALLLGKRYLTPVLAAMVALCGLFFVALPAGMEVDTTYQYGFLRCMGGFFIGHMVYKFWQRSSGKKLGQPALWEFGSVALLLIFPCLPYFQSYTILTPLLLAIPLWVFTHQQGPISRVLLTRPLQYLGLLSYSIYMVHGLILVFMKRSYYMYEKVTHKEISFDYLSPWAHKAQEVFVIGNPWVMDVMTVGYLALVVFAAGLATRFVENPGRRYFNGLAKRLEAKRG